MWIFDKLFNRKIEGKSSLDSLEVLAGKVSIDENGYIVFTNAEGELGWLSAIGFNAGPICYEDDGVYSDDESFLLTSDGMSKGVQSVATEGYEPEGKVLTSDGSGRSSWKGIVDDSFDHTTIQSYDDSYLDESDNLVLELNLDDSQFFKDGFVLIQLDDEMPSVTIEGVTYTPKVLKLLACEGLICSAPIVSSYTADTREVLLDISNSADNYICLMIFNGLVSVYTSYDI